MQQQVFKRSTISGIFVDRQSFGDETSKGFHFNKNNYNRVWGLDYNLLSENGKCYGRFYHHTSSTSGVARKFFEPDQSTHGSFLRYNGRKWQFFTGHTYIGKEYNPETGFAPRTNYLNFRNSAGRTFYPKNEGSKIANLSTVVTYAIDFTPQFKKTDHIFYQENYLSFKNRSALGYAFTHNYIKLSYGFDPSISGGELLPAGSAYNYFSQSVIFRSDPTKKISYSVSGNGGSYFNGRRFSTSGSVTLKTQPWGLFSVNYRYTSIQLPQPYSENKIFVAGPRADVSFSPNWRFTSVVQYNSLNKNLGNYMRLQWRFKPLSNLFLVYQDNYDTGRPGVKSRSAAIKWEWWL